MHHSPCDFPFLIIPKDPEEKWVGQRYPVRTDYAGGVSSGPPDNEEIPTVGSGHQSKEQGARGGLNYEKDNEGSRGR